MKKAIFVAITAILVGIGGLFGYSYYYNYHGNLTKEKSKEVKQNEVESIRQNKIIKNELKKIEKREESRVTISEPITKTQDERIETLKKRFTLRGIIARGDDFFVSNQLILALNEYQKAFRQNPKDEQIIKKLALTYFELKRYSNAVEEFSKIEKFLNKEEIDKYILALIYVTNYKSKEDLRVTLDKIKSLNITQEEKFYYTNVINSVLDFHTSKKSLENYFASNKNITFQKLINIKNAIDNYKNFQINDLYYKDTLIIGALFNDKMFSISNILAENLLATKNNYKPLLLILGEGYYELGDLKNAKKYFESYYNLEPNNSNVAYILGVINFKLRDYIASNLYYNAALENGFEPKAELQRRLIYNYYLLGDKRLMLNMFSHLLNENDSTIDDFSLGIYHAILEGRTLNATSRSEKGLQKFFGRPGYEVFYAYLGWIKREENDLEKSREYLTSGMKINPKNPLLTLNMGYLEEAEERYDLALVYFRRTININGDGEFGELARKEIEEIEKYLEAVRKIDKI